MDDLEKNIEKMRYAILDHKDQLRAAKVENNELHRQLLIARGEVSQLQDLVNNKMIPSLEEANRLNEMHIAEMKKRD